MREDTADSQETQLFKYDILSIGSLLTRSLLCGVSIQYEQVCCHLRSHATAEHVRRQCAKSSSPTPHTKKESLQFLIAILAYKYRINVRRFR